MELPNLNVYRDNFIKEGINLPLPTVPSYQGGILSKLPSSDNSKLGWPWTVESKAESFSYSEQMRWPKLSIVMPSYNQGKFIEQTIRSVLLQNYPNLEFIVCDGGSDDETLEILDKYKPWLSFYQSKKDRGQGHAINLGFSIASGDYIGWINSDDFYLPNCFQTVISTFLKCHSDIVYGESISLYDNDTKLYYCYGYLVLDRYLRVGGIVPSHCTFWKSSIHVSISEEIVCAIDYELWLRLFPKRTKKHLKIPLGVYRVQPSSKSSNEKYKAYWQQDYEKILSNHSLLPQSRIFNLEFKIIQTIYKYLRKPIHKDLTKYFSQNNLQK